MNYKYYKINGDLIKSDGEHHAIMSLLYTESGRLIREGGSYRTINGAVEITKEDYLIECMGILGGAKFDAIKDLEKELESTKNHFDNMIKNIEEYV